jgi:hypothetical protein
LLDHSIGAKEDGRHEDERAQVADRFLRFHFGARHRPNYLTVPNRAVGE